MIWPRTSMGSGFPASIRGSSRAWAASRAVYITPVIRTRSPAFSDSASASLSGGVTSFVPSAPIVIIADTPSLARSQHGLFVAMGVALDGDRHRQAGDVTRIREDVDAEGGGVAAVALRADPQPVGPVQDLALDRGHRRVGVRRAQLAEERLLAEPGGLLESAADADASDQRRAGVWPRGPDALEDPLLDALHALGGSEHLVLRAVLAAAPLGHDRDPEIPAWHDVQVDHRGRVVAGVHPVEGRAYDRRPQVAFLVALTQIGRAHV